MKKFIILFSLFLSCVNISISQNIEYFETDTERYWGINKNSWGGLIGGGILKFSNKISNNLYKTIGFELVNIKHPKENKYSSALGYGRTFVWGKKNYLFSLRGQYGRELTVVNKRDYQGVRVNAQLAIGPSLGLLMPYFIKYSRNNRMVIENFDSTVHTFNNVIGSPSYFEVIDQIKIKPGLNIKAALNFEFGSQKTASAIEVGFLGEIFTDEVVIMPTAKNYSFYPTAFITLFYGRKY